MSTKTIELFPAVTSMLMKFNFNLKNDTTKKKYYASPTKKMNPSF